MLRKLWHPNKKGKKLNPYGGTDPLGYTSHNFTP